MKQRCLKFTAFSVIILIGFIIALGAIYFKCLNHPLLTGSQPAIVFQLEKNETASHLIANLQQKDLIEFPRLLAWIIRIQGISSRLQAGFYEIEAGETVGQLLQKIATGDVMRIAFRITEGTTQYQVQQSLQNSPYLVYESEDWQTIMGRHLNAEGLLLADTYQYKAGSMATQLLQQSHRNLEQALEQAWLQRDTALPYTSSYQLLIAASIIEKETALANERRLISGVIVNRLKKKMRLQMDPTVIYGLGLQFDGKLTKSDLKKPTPYNTYVHYGLPPTPIAMVGRDAIEAAAHPLQSNYLYYVAKGDGSHQFSENYEQQKKAVEDYIIRKHDQ